MILFSCKPEVEKPTVVTKSVGEVTETTAKVVGQVTADGGAEVTERGVCWNTAPAPEVIHYRVKDAEGGLGIFTLNLSNLEPQTTYYVRAYATNEKGVSYGEELTFTTKKEIELPEIKTAEVEDITESEAVSGGEVISDGGAEVTARGICWSTTQNPTIEDNKTTDGSGVGTFASEMTDLEADTKYYVRAYATNEKGTAYGEEVSFTTLEVTPEDPENPGGEDPENPGGEDPENPGGEDPENPGGEGPENPGGEDPENPGGEDPENPGSEDPENPENPEQPEDPETPEQPEEPENPIEPEQPVGPVVITADITEIALYSAKCGGGVSDGGGAVVVERGVCWNTSGNPTVLDFTTKDGSGLGSYISNITGLEHGTTYYVRAYAANANGVAGYGKEVSFTTLDKLLPTVTTATEVTDITVGSATCGGEVTSDGDGKISARGVCWSTMPNPTIEDNKTTDGSGVGIFTSNLSNLEHNTTYYVRAYATNEVGTAYGEEVSFTTMEKLLPTVTTATEVTDITVGSATCGGEVTFDGNVSVTARGICWSTMPNPTIEDNKTTDGSGVGIFTLNLSNLEHNTTYYVRACATNEVGTAYGEEVSFTTLAAYSPATGTSNGYGYVDLGLSVKWATCNVGASKPEEYGDYFAWGETSTKKTYDYDNCPTNGLSISELQSQGYIDSEVNLTSQYDAATANWGGDWRMPTDDELTELRKCTWTWITQNGVNGYNVEGPNGNSIFLPAAGYRGGWSLNLAGSYGYYWRSTPSKGSGYFYACHLYFSSDGHRTHDDCRYLGLSVRPVLE